MRFARGMLIMAAVSAATVAPTMSAHAGVGSAKLYISESDFVSETGAMASPEIPNLGKVNADGETLGDMTISIASPSSALLFGTLNNSFPSSPTPWTDLLGGNQIAISGSENLNIKLARPSFAFGFQYVEVTDAQPHINGPFVESTFEVSLKNDAGDTVQSYQLNPDNDTALFSGIWTSAPFNQVEIREMVGGIGNEFFGRLFSNNVPFSGVVTIPEPASLGLVMAGLIIATRGTTRRTAQQSKRRQ